MVASVRRRHSSRPGNRASRSRTSRPSGILASRLGAHVDERQRRHRVGPLLGQGRGHRTPRWNARSPSPGPRRAGPARRRPGGPGRGCRTRPAGLADLPWPSRSTRMTRQAPASCGTTGSHQAVEAAVPWISSKRGRARPAVLHDVHVTIVKPHEPVVSVRIAGHGLRHVRCPSCGGLSSGGLWHGAGRPGRPPSPCRWLGSQSSLVAAGRLSTVVTAVLPQRSAYARHPCLL